MANVRGPELVFIPLGGVGEIGMNFALYGYGPADRREWVIVDCGVTFPTTELPGVDLVLPDIRFIEENLANLRGIVITHAHEDHYGALLDLWPRLKAQCWMTPFTAGLLEAKRQSEPGAPKVPVTIYRAGEKFSVGPFAFEAIPVGALHPRADVAGHHHAGRHHHPHRRLEDRPGSRHWAADRRAALPCARRRRRAGADLRFHQRHTRRRLAVGEGGGRQLAQTDLGGEGQGGDHQLLLQRRPPQAGRRGSPRRRPRGAGARRAP